MLFCDESSPPLRPSPSQESAGLEVLVVENSGTVWPACLGNCLRNAARSNHSLQVNYYDVICICTLISTVSANQHRYLTACKNRTILSGDSDCELLCPHHIRPTIK